MLAARLAAKRGDGPPSTAPEEVTAWHRGPAKVVALVVAGARRIGRLFSKLVSPLTNGFQRMETAIEAAYPRACRAALMHRALVLVVAALGFFATLLLGGRIGVELIPTLTQGEFYFDIELPEGAPLSVTDRLLETVGAEAAGLDDVAGGGRIVTTAGSLGASSVDASARGENRGRIHVVMADKDDREAERRTIAQLREALGRFPGLGYQFDRPSYFSFKRPVELEVHGDDVDELGTWAAVIAEAMEAIPGLTDVRSSSEMGNPELQVFFAVDRMAQMGLTVDEVSETLRTKLRGNVATRLNEGERKIDIVVRASADARARADQVPELIVHEAEERAVPLKAVARTRLVAGPSEIRRVGQRRAVVISGNLDGRDLGSVTSDIDAVIAGLSLPSSIGTRFAGQQLEIQGLVLEPLSCHRACHLPRLFRHGEQVRIADAPVHHLVHDPARTHRRHLGFAAHGQHRERPSCSSVSSCSRAIVVKNAIVLVDYIKPSFGKRGWPVRRPSSRRGACGFARS